jgi:hypothetical protein
MMRMIMLMNYQKGQNKTESKELQSVQKCLVFITKEKITNLELFLKLKNKLPELRKEWDKLLCFLDLILRKLDKLC